MLAATLEPWKVQVSRGKWSTASVNGLRGKSNQFDVLAVLTSMWEWLFVVVVEQIALKKKREIKLKTMRGIDIPMIRNIDIEDQKVTEAPCLKD